MCLTRALHPATAPLVPPSHRSAYVKKGAKDSRYERVYYPIHPESTPVELVIACIITALEVANKILCAQVGAYCYVARLEIRDYVSAPNIADEFVDKLAPSIQKMGDKLSDGIRRLSHR